MVGGASLGDMVLGFFEGEPAAAAAAADDEWLVDEEEDGGGDDPRAFWEEQHQLLEGALGRIGSAEAKIRTETEKALRECGRKHCVLRDVAHRLRDAGYNSGLCKSKWRKSPDIPSGEHSYIDVVVEAKGGRKSPIRVVIELNFRSEFEVARGSPEYNSLVGRLPEVFVGKSERLRNVVKVMCAAAKRCMKDNQMHMGPWRKHKYMQSKWLGTCERIVVPPPMGQPLPPPPPAAVASGDRQRRVRASMLTFDLHCTAVEVV